MSDRYERDREERRQYDADVFYEVWRSGRNPDRINDDRVSDSYYQGRSADEAASTELRAMRRVEESRREDEQQQEDEYYRQMEEHYQQEGEQP